MLGSRAGFVLPRCFRDAEVNPASLILRGRPAAPGLIACVAARRTAMSAFINKSRGRTTPRASDSRAMAAQPSTPSARPTLVKAATARSMWAVVCAAESWTRMRDCPRGTTGKKKPFT